MVCPFWTSGGLAGEYGSRGRRAGGGQPARPTPVRPSTPWAVARGAVAGSNPVRSKAIAPRSATGPAQRTWSRVRNAAARPPARPGRRRRTPARPRRCCSRSECRCRPARRPRRPACCLEASQASAPVRRRGAAGGPQRLHGQRGRVHVPGAGPHPEVERDTRRPRTAGRPGRRRRSAGAPPARFSATIAYDWPKALLKSPNADRSENRPGRRQQVQQPGPQVHPAERARVLARRPRRPASAWRSGRRTTRCRRRRCRR